MKFFDAINKLFDFVFLFIKDRNQICQFDLIYRWRLRHEWVLKFFVQNSISCWKFSYLCFNWINKSDDEVLMLFEKQNIIKVYHSS